MGKRILIVGAGYAGIAAALRLNRKGKRDGLEIAVIDKNPYHTLLTEIHEVAGNRQDEDAVRVPLGEIFRDTRVEVIRDEVQGFDFDNKRINGAGGVYAYDYCVLAVGSTPAFYDIPGMKEHAFTLWSLENAVRVRDHIRGCFRQAGNEADAGERRRLLTFVVGGAGYTGVEMIGELAHWVRPLCREFNVERREVRLILLDMLKRVLPNLDERNSARAHAYMTKKLGVEVQLETAITQMKADRALTSRGELETRTVIWCAGVCSNEQARQADAGGQGGLKRVQVDEYCRTGRDGVYAIGDCGGLSGDDGRPYAAMVENALQSGEGAAENILRAVRGKKPERVRVKFHGTMVSVGSYFAVSEIMGRRLPSWMSLLMKYMVNVHYLFGIMGIRGPVKYLQDEAYHRKQDKVFVEKQYSQKMQAWWAVPLRMFLGAYWLYEGIVKIAEGWLSGPKLAEFMGMARSYQTAVDTVTSATGGGAALRLDTLVDINLKVGQFILGSASKLVEGNTITSDYFAKINLFHFDSFNLVPWLVQNLALSSGFGEMFFQVVITLAEVAVGLMLLGGLFTLPAALASVGLLAMFVTSTGLYMDTWWMVPAAIVCMGGAARGFGMDYYAIPWFNRAFEYFWKNRGVKLFFPGGKGKRAVKAGASQRHG